MGMESSTKNQMRRRGFLQSGKAVWVFEGLTLIVIGIIVHYDIDLPLRSILLPVNISGLEEFPGVYESHLAQMKHMAFLIYALTSMLITLFIAEHRNRRELRKRIASLASRDAPISAEEFIQMRHDLVTSRLLSSSEFTGVYILHNTRKDTYYVGQSIRVLSRINQHLTGHGNGDVYADYKHGDAFTVSTIPFQNSGYQSLNDLERDTIAAYDAQSHGYNMTRGNQR